MKMEREYLIKALMEEVSELTKDEANIILDSLIELLDRSISIGHNVRLIGFGEKPLLFNAKETDLSSLLVQSPGGRRGRIKKMESQSALQEKSSLTA